MDLNDTDRLILAKLREGRAKPAYLAEELGKQQAYISQRLKHLVGEGLVVRVFRGLYGHAALETEHVDAARLVEEMSVRDLIDPTGEAAPGDDLGGTESTPGRDPEKIVRDWEAKLIDDDTAESSAEETGSPAPDPGGERSETGTKPPAQQPEQPTPADPEGILRDLGLPGSGAKLDARIDALLSIYNYLCDRPGEAVEKSELQDLVDADAVGYGSVGSFWTNCVKANKSQGRDTNALVALPGVEDWGDGEYRYGPGGDDGDRGDDLPGDGGVYDPTAEFE